MSHRHTPGTAGQRQKVAAPIELKLSQLMQSRVPAKRARVSRASAEPGPRFSALGVLGPWVPGLQRTAREERALRCARDTQYFLVPRCICIRVAVLPLFTMSNSVVFFVPAARCCARVLLSCPPPR